MLYVFQMDVGQMLTFDISLLMDTVSRLQKEIARVTGITVEQQILLLSGGQSLHPDQKVISYGAGADTNPVFLFSKLAITSQEPPLIKSFGVPKDVINDLKDRVAKSVKLPVSFDTVKIRTQLATHLRDNAGKVLNFCNNEFKEQHLQHQGWSAVVANLEEIAHALQKTRAKFSKMFAAFVLAREKHFSLLSNFQETLDLLGRIPLLKPLREEEEADLSLIKRKSVSNSEVLSFVATSPTPSNLLEWITTQSQGQSLEGLQLKCYNDLVFFNEEMFEQYDRDVNELLDQVSADNQMKALVGIERRLSELEKRLNEAKKIAKTQSDIAQAFINQQARLNSLPDSSILPDLCSSHQRQLRQMYDGHLRLEALQGNFCRSKQEMSTNIHHRLGWVVLIETKISKLDSDLIFHMKTLKLLEVNLELLSQVKVAPQVYAEMVLEAARRKIFSQLYLEWADNLVEDSRKLYDTEFEQRKNFIAKLGQHFFLHTLFKGFEDMPPNFATKSPQQFDHSLPNITSDDISQLKLSVPELSDTLSISIVTPQFPQSSSSKKRQMSISPFYELPNSQSSQTEWSQQAAATVSVVKATEAPPTTFSLPELHESHATVYLPAVSSLTDTMQDVIVTDTASQDASGLSVTCADLPESDRPSSGGSHSSRRKAKANSIHTTESTSPPSSNDFATADFYFEDAMPSPMRSNTDSQIISSLQAELLEKVNLIKDLEERLLQSSELLVKAASSSQLTEPSGSLTLVGGADVSDQSTTSNTSITLSQDISAVEATQDAGLGHRPCCRHDHDERIFSQNLAIMNQTVVELQDSLKTAEKNLASSEERYITCVSEKNKTVSDLEGRLAATDVEIEHLKTEVERKESDIKGVEERLCESDARNEKLNNDLNKVEESLVRVREKLFEFRDNAKEQLPSFRHFLGELKTSVLTHKQDVESSVTMTMASLAERVNIFNASVLADAIAEFSKEKDALTCDIVRLKAELSAAKADSNEKVVHLNQHNEDLSSKLSDMECQFNKNLEEHQAAFNLTLKEMETKHSLEMELELDKCRIELRKNIEESEQLASSQKCLAEEAKQELEDLMRKTDEERATQETVHIEKIHKMEREHQKLLETTKTELTMQLQSDFKEKLMQGNNEISQLQSRLESLESSLATEKGEAVSRLKEEHQSALHEIELKLEEQRAAMTQCLEEEQLKHAHKLTELKTQFDMERDSLLKKIKDHAMTSSETQTDLLADVISLTSSASYGSEEMIANNRQSSTQSEEKESSTVDSVDNSARQQQAIEDLNIKLAAALEKIGSLQNEVATVNKEKEELKSHKQIIELPMSSPEKLSQSRLLDMMESTMADNSCSFILMDKDQTPSLNAPPESDEVKVRDEKIAELEKKVMEMSMTVSEKPNTSDKVSIKGCERGDLVLLCLDERHDQYVVFTVGTNLHFLHSDSLDSLGLKRGGDISSRVTWTLAEVVDKEYCLAKKPNNRFRVPQGTCFYRVKCKPWKNESDCTRQDRESQRYSKSPKSDHGMGARPKKSKS